jgi:hypothetical protein
MTGRGMGRGIDPSGVTIWDAVPDPGLPAGPVLALAGGRDRDANGSGTTCGTGAAAVTACDAGRTCG